MATSKRSVLALPQPLILLPASRLTMPVSKEIGETLLSLIEESDALPIVAAVPLTSSSSKTPESEASLSEWGTAARVLRLVKPPARNPRQTYLVTLHGLTRVRLINLSKKKISMKSLQQMPILDIEYHRADKIPSAEGIEKFKQSALRLLDRLTKDSVQQARKEGYIKIANMLEDIADDRTPWMADVLIGTVNGEYNDKLAILATPDSDARLQLATEIFLKQASISEVSKKIATAVDESLSKQQKEFFLRQQLAAIHRELQALQRSNGTLPGSPPTNESGSGTSSELDDDEQHEADDMADLKQKIETMQPGSEERRMGVREWRRLKRIPAGSVENGVIRTYLEWLTSVPWPNSIPSPGIENPAAESQSKPQLKDRSFLVAARSQLDADHFGLEKVKKRLIEYLAVVRLKELNAEKEIALEQKRTAEALDLQSQTRLSVESKTDGKGTRITTDEQDKSKDVVVRKQLPKPTTVNTSRRLKKVKGPILLFVGPPGTGKTSLGQSIAKALNRPFQRISLGGVRDEAEIRGHRRTYVASGPGLVVQALRKAGCCDPVILLDEIDKVGQSNFHGDPGAALLEVLDPEQNHTFNDHYINVPIDLSQVLFICTANSLETISAPLLDRCEIIQLSGYTYDEKMHIARRFLLPKQLKANGLDASHVTITEPALLRIATRYTREAGVRNLERSIGGVVRYKAVEWSEYLDNVPQSQGDVVGVAISPPAPSAADGAVVSMPKKVYDRVVEENQLEKILGIARWDGEEKEREVRRGVVYGLVVMGQGEGGILPVETIVLPGTGKLKLTGSLGDVIKESGELALSWVKMYAYDLCITNSRSQDPLKVPEPIDIHLHLPAGAQKKDGPSAGIAMTCAFVSLLTGACVPPNIAMTGEITLRGRVTPVGGIKEKVLGAHRAQITKVILPWANRKDVEHDVALDIRNEMQFVFVRTVREALEAAFGKGVLGWRRDTLMLESRL